MQIIQHRIIDLARRLPMLPLDAVQGDGSTRLVRLTLLENGESWAVPEGVTAAVAFRKADGKKGLYDALPDGTQAVAMEGSTVTAILAPQVLSCPGDTYAAVVFHDGELNQLATFPFVIRVKGNPAAGQSVSNDYYRYGTMEAVSEAMEASLAKAEEAMGMACDAAPAIVCEAAGESITVADAAQRPLKGLSIYGKTTQNGTPTPENPVALESAGESGSIGVTVAGKNLFDDIGWFESHGFAKQSDGSWSGILLNKPCWTNTAKVKGSIYLTVIAKTEDTTIPLYLLTSYTDGTGDTSVRLLKTDGFATVTAITDPNKTVDYITWSWSTGGEYFIKGVSISFVDNAYEPYKPLQTLTASTPNGLHSVGDIKDEIDFARGMYVRRAGRIDSYAGEDISGDYMSTTGELSVGATVIYVLAQPIETPLSAEELAAYGALRSNEPNTTVFNDAGAGMKLSYVADTKLYIDNKITAISKAMIG